MQENVEPPPSIPSIVVTPDPDEMDVDDLPATQPFDDPRKDGRNNSGLTERDLADVVCILHPTSNPAIRDVEHNIKRNPQLILQNGDLLGSTSPPVPLGSRDIALRLSATVKDRPMGFKLGRDSRLCDIVLGTIDPAHVSKTHFRIYLTEHDILMIQDMSTNGTLVDQVLLRHKPGYHDCRTLTNGSIITVGLVHNEEIKFIARIPSRHGYEDMYEDNLRDYHQAIADELEKRKRNPAKNVVPNVVSIAGAHLGACFIYHPNVSG